MTPQKSLSIQKASLYCLQLLLLKPQETTFTSNGRKMARISAWMRCDSNVVRLTRPDPFIFKVWRKVTKVRKQWNDLTRISAYSL